MYRLDIQEDPQYVPMPNPIRSIPFDSCWLNPQIFRQFKWLLGESMAQIWHTGWIWVPGIVIDNWQVTSIVHTSNIMFAHILVYRQWTYIYIYIHIIYTYIWVNYNDLTATSLESWLVRLVRGIIPKLPYFRLMNYYNLPRYIYIYGIY